ncbi:unnamed protein product [Polarella glacialis]|uniref:Lipoprotein n=1 Tax=Polarella glacialis TaxID=89957 RepID=A0A813M0F7_POLGL|nr:unnamed protein product [Polarella glacialis]
MIAAVSFLFVLVAVAVSLMGCTDTGGVADDSAATTTTTTTNTITTECHDFGFDLVDLTSSESEGLTAPADPDCFYSVTIDALLDAGLMNYSWIPHSKSNENAPSGAFVYKKADGTLLYKKIVSNPSSDAALQFSCQKPLVLETVQHTEELSKGTGCFNDTVSLASKPFVDYSTFAWVRFSTMPAGGFVYQLKGTGALVVHEVSS